MSGLQSTFDCLRKERSDAAQSVWLVALATDRKFVRDQAFRAALAGAPLAVQLAVIRSWKTMDDADRKLLADSISSFLPGLKQALSQGNSEDRNAAIAMALSLKIHNLISDLAHLAESNDESCWESAARVVLRLAQSLKNERLVSGSSSTDKHLRSRVVGSLEQSVKRFVSHRRIEIVHAFLTLTDANNSVLVNILDCPSDLSLTAVSRELQRTQYELISNDLLIDFLDSQHVPSVIQRLWSTRDDLRFVEAFLKALADEPRPELLRNAGRIHQLDWIENWIDRLAELSLDAQFGLLALTDIAKLEPSIHWQILRRVAGEGDVRARAMAVRRMGTFRNDEANQFIMSLTDSDHIDVRAEALTQLRERNLPGAMNRLRVALDDPHPLIREAAVSAFHDYTVDWYLAGFDIMDPVARRANGEIVRRVDTHAAERLRNELTQSGRNRKLRALSAAQLLEVLVDLQDLVVGALQEKDQFVRIEAANALGNCPTPEAREALNAALTDPMASVREAAAHSLQVLAATRPRSSTTDSTTNNSRGTK